jgi:hypothetical protein
MSKLIMILGGWLALNAAVAIMLLTRPSRPHLRHRLFRWVYRPPARPRRLAHNLIVAHRHHH